MNVLFQGDTDQKGKDEWLTPPSILKNLGVFDLDPCSPITRPFETAKNYFTKKDNGLLQNWFGRVWCNPPYGREVSKWLKKCSEHKNVIALIFARTDTKWFQKFCFNADSILFISSRLKFYHVSGMVGKWNAGCGSCLVSWDKANTTALKKSKIKGKLIELK